MWHSAFHSQTQKKREKGNYNSRWKWPTFLFLWRTTSLRVAFSFLLPELLQHLKPAFTVWRQLIAHIFWEGLVSASIGYMVNEAIYMLIATRGNFLIMYVNEHICCICVGQIQTVNNMLTSCQRFTLFIRMVIKHCRHTWFLVDRLVSIN